MHRILLIIATVLLVLTTPLQAADQEVYPFETEEQKQQFRQLRADIRCPKCLNSNLAGSDAPIAQDLTDEIYAQIQRGQSNDQIIDFMKSRYGDFITYKPPLTSGTFLLWFGPAILLMGGFLVIWRTAKNTKSNDAALSAEEEQRLQEILSEEQK